MTNEEAKQIFLDRGFVNGVFDGNKWRESVIVISKWLKQESCEDKISEWKKDFKEYINLLSMPRDDYNGIMEYIDELHITHSVEQTNSILEDIKEEINQIRILHNNSGIGYGLDIALGIIDKYITES